MSKLNEKLSEALDIEPIDFTTTEVVVAENVIDDDAEFARQNLRKLIEKGNIAADNILHVAKESEHPRAYEVAANMMKHLADMNKDLLEIQKRKQDLQPKPVDNKGAINVNKAVFVGSTAEFIKQLREAK
jgi:hypothetical protein|tara:strand:+ start:331 stop:720 length:390 start_codon:yes stop_codon:yes gene_type:complete